MKEVKHIVQAKAARKLLKYQRIRTIYFVLELWTWRNLEKFIKCLAHKDQQNIVMKWESKFLFMEMKTELHKHSNIHSSKAKRDHFREKEKM